MLTSLTSLMKIDLVFISKIVFKISVNFNIQEHTIDLVSGDLLLIKGNNGQGKTTWLKRLSVADQRMDLSFNDCKIKSWDHNWLMSQAVLWHENGWLDALSVSGNMKQYGLIYDEAFSQKPMGALSAGQKQMLALKRVMMSNRPVWILDEPLSYLDKTKQRWFMDVIKQHSQIGGIVIVSSHHDLDIIESGRQQVVRL